MVQPATGGREVCILTNHNQKDDPSVNRAGIVNSDDILDITNAAVRALDKPIIPDRSLKATTLLIYGNHGITGEGEEVSPNSTVSSGPGDVLARSTNPVLGDFQNDWEASGRPLRPVSARVQLGNGSFNTAGVRTVKISRAQVCEVPSPSFKTVEKESFIDKHPPKFTVGIKRLDRLSDGEGQDYKKNRLAKISIIQYIG